jgi:hypothetical protein
MLLVDSSDIDELGHVNNAAYVRWLERCAWRHSESLGLGVAEYKTLDRAMVVLRHEIDYLASRQVKGDIIVFDDYTPEVYPGVVKAVNYLRHTYEIEILGNIKIRGYAILTRI